jgi:PD-(D/E)XK endonuclease
MSCASFSSARPAIRRAWSSEVRGSFVLCGSFWIVAPPAGVPNRHGPAGAIGRLSWMTTDQKGAIAEAAIALAAMKLGIDVYRPLGEGGRYDLILDVGSRLLRVQCKWAASLKQVLVVRCYTFRRTRTGWKKTTYSADEVDVIAAYSMDLDRCFLIPIELVEKRPTIQLRVSPTLNNQKRRINWADDFDFEATLRRHQGAVAQLGERQSGTLEVRGSIPLGSIS